MNIQETFETASEHQRAGRLDEAERLYRRILEAAPGHAESLNMLAAIALQAGRPRQAADLAGQALAAAEDNPVFHATAGQARLALNEAEAALVHFRRAGELAPDFAAARFLAGLACVQLGREDEALSAYEEAARLDPGFAQAHYNAGALLEQKGERAAAAEKYRAAIEAVPDFPVALVALAMLLAGDGEVEEATGLLERAVRIDPNWAGAHSALGSVLLSKGRTDRAVAQLRQAARLAPGDAEIRYNLGLAYLQAGRVEAALSCFRDAVAGQPDLAPAHYQLGLCYRRQRRPEDAETHLRRAVELEPEDPAARASLGAVLLHLGRYDDAIAEIDRALALDPRQPAAWNARGQHGQIMGRFDEARSCFEKALESEPGNSTALFLLSQMDPSPDPAREIARLEDALERHDPTPRQRARLHFARARHLEAAGDDAAAFAAARTANEILHERQQWDPAALRTLVDRTLALLTREFFAAAPPAGSDSERPVFIVGMPRSGTTLVEQILASHPRVAAAGEFRGMLHVQRLLEARHRAAPTTLADMTAGLDPATAATLAGEYVSALGKVSADAHRIVDKFSLNFMRLGLIARLFPRARIIHCARDPFDTCLSCYFQNFEADYPWASDLGEIASLHRECDRLMAHWHDVLPLDILKVPYEDLVGDPETWIRRIVEHAGLDWDERCLDFHETVRPVATPAFWQVRQPVYTSSVGRWRRHAGNLDPAFEILGRPPGDAD